MRKNRAINYEWDRNKTILDNFKNLPNKDNDSVVGFLSICNATLLASLGSNNITEKLKEEIIDFFDYFVDNYEKRTRKARLSNWPNDALILRVGYEYCLEKDFLKTKEEIKKFPYQVQDEAEELRDIIFKIRKDKIITITFSDGSSEVLQIPGTIPKEYLENFKLQTLYYFCLMIEMNGNAVVRIVEKKNRFSIFGVLCLNNRWEPLSKELMERSHNYDQNGNPVEPEEGVTFIQISKPARYMA